MTTKAEIAKTVYALYRAAYDGEVQGCCLVIADDIRRLVGGEVVAGEITFYGGSVRRTHWWVVAEDEVLDPMGDDLMSEPGDYPERVEVHRDQTMFTDLLPLYERWRVTVSAVDSNAGEWM